MKTLVIYDSLFGNTEKVAKAIGSSIKGSKVLNVGKVKLQELNSYDLLIVGSPTHGGRPSQPIQSFLNDIPNSQLKGVKVAAFDTRFSYEDHGLGLKFVMKVLNFAASRIADTLKKKGGEEITSPMGFIVEGKEGPLKKDELEKALSWPLKFKK